MSINTTATVIDWTRTTAQDRRRNNDVTFAFDGSPICDYCAADAPEPDHVKSFPVRELPEGLYYCDVCEQPLYAVFG